MDANGFKVKRRLDYIQKKINLQIQRICKSEKM